MRFEDFLGYFIFQLELRRACGRERGEGALWWGSMCHKYNNEKDERGSRMRSWAIFFGIQISMKLGCNNEWRESGGGKHRPNQKAPLVNT